MVGYEQIEINDKTAIYEYYPENKKTAKGIISYDRSSGEIQFIERSKDDMRSTYAWHLRSQLDEFNETGNFRESGYVAWW